MSNAARVPVDPHGHILQDWTTSDGDMLFVGPLRVPPASATVAPTATIHNAAPTPILYLTESGDTAAISVNDIHQGQIGDCFLLSAIGEIALCNPTAIAGMIHVNPNGTETVGLWSASSRGFVAKSQIVANSFAANGVNNGATQDVSGGQKEIWAQVLEKAYAQGNGGYAGIQNGGNPAMALQQLTGNAASWVAPASLTVDALTKDMAAGDLMVFDTAKANSQYNLVGSHAYMFEGLDVTRSAVKLGNPWGFDQPSLVPIAQLSRAFVEVDIGHLR